jgi:hypothetical protein
MCCGPYDYHYPTMGGKHERVDPVYGRVGSILSDPLAPRAAQFSADSNLLPPPPLELIDDNDGNDALDTDDEMDRIKRDLEDITPLDGKDDLPDLEDLEDKPVRRPINKKTRLDRHRPIR